MNISPTPLHAVDDERRCTCGALLAVQNGHALHVKCQGFVGLIRGDLQIRCRRCGRTVMLLSARRTAA